jgi:hypothetical protein
MGPFQLEGHTLPPAPLPENVSLLIRTDFSDDDAWVEVTGAAQAEEPIDGFAADLALIDDPAWDGMPIDTLLQTIGEPPPFYVFVADRETLTHPEHPILAIDIASSDYPDERGQTVRVVPTAMASVENNLSLGNMDFGEFIEGADADGIFRQFS